MTGKRYSSLHIICNRNTAWWWMCVNNQFGRVIKEKRKKLGYTQEALAEMVGRSTGQIGQIERGEDYPSVEVLIKLIDVLSIDPRLLFTNQAVTNELQDTMVMFGKLEPQTQELISATIRFAYTQMRNQQKNDIKKGST